MTMTSLFLSSAAGLALAAAQPQPAPAPQPEEMEDGFADEGEEIIVTGQRLPGQVIGDIPPENTLDPRDIRATGATDVTELLEAIAPQIGSARGRGGERPVLLLNGQRISSFRELRDIPTEAIARVEVLPEEVALKYGYRADQRVVNFVLRPRFRSTIVQLEGGGATDGGYARGELDVDRLMLSDKGRTTISLDAERNGMLRESERDIVAAGPDEERDQPFRSLVGSGTQLRAAVTANRTLSQSLSGTVNLEVERDSGRTLSGLSDVVLDPLVRRRTSRSAHLGAVVNGTRDRWRWSATANADLATARTRSDRADEGPDDEARTRTRSADLELTANGPLFALPAGDAGLTVKAGAGTLRLDADRRADAMTVDTSLSRTQGSLAANVDLPVSKRGGDFSALGNFTVNLNGAVQRLSDFGTLHTVGAGINLSPVDRLNLVASWTREEGAPGIGQLGDPVLETQNSRIFDFTTGETVLVTAVTGGNPALLADRRTVWKLGANYKPFNDKDLRIRGEYVQSRLDDPVAAFPGASAALEAAFPERFQRDSAGRLVRVDLRPVNYDSARKDVIRWGVDFTKPLRTAPPSAETIARLREQRARARGETPPPAPGDGQNAAPAAGNAEPAAGPRAGPGGGRGFGRFGDRRGGRLQLSFIHTLTLTDRVAIRPGLPGLDYLDGDALSQLGGRARHEVETRAGWSNNGLGAFLSGNWRSGTRVTQAGGETLRFAPLATFDLRLFANLGERPELVSRHRWLRGTSLRLEVDNLLNARPRVRDGLGAEPIGYQSDLLDPLGRTVSLSIRKLFLPPRRGGEGRPGGASD